MSQQISEPVNSYLSFLQCFYGCKLDSKTLKWDCKFSSNIKEADAYAFSDGDALATKLVPVTCVFAKYPSFLKEQILKSDLAFDVKTD